jgi:hypothetical protein
VLAQMIVGQLRDGLRMLFLSGRHVVLIDLLNGLGDRSRVFDPFRKRAFRPACWGSFFAILIVDGRGEWR